MRRLAMTNFEFMQAAEKKVAQCWATLMTRSGKAYPSPKLTFGLRGRAAGMHHGATGEIELNMSFVAKDGQDMLDQTVPHEVCHAWLTVIRDPSHVRSYETLQAYALNKAYYGARTRRPKRNPHGDTFMRTLASLGCRTERCHNYDMSEIQTKRQARWDYKCPKCGKAYHLSTCIHNKMLRGQIRYCIPCGRVEGRLERVY